MINSGARRERGREGGKKSVELMEWEWKCGEGGGGMKEQEVRFHDVAERHTERERVYGCDTHITGSVMQAVWYWMGSCNWTSRCTTNAGRIKT